MFQDFLTVSGSQLGITRCNIRKNKNMEINKIFSKSGLKMWHFIPVKRIEEVVDRGISAVEALTVEDDTDNALFIVL
jgi:hypothetical protein